MIIDTHTHLYLPEFGDNPQAAVDSAVNAGVTTMILPNVDLTTIEPMRALHAQRPDVTRMAMGLHPTEVNENFKTTLDSIIENFNNFKDDYIAIGEIGIDLYWDKTFEQQQMDVFEQQARLAVENNLPIIIHCRDGLDQTLEVLGGLNDIPHGVFHSFGGTIADVEKIRKTGDFYFGINGIVTFKNSKLDQTLDTIGTDRLLIETDAPYLAPVPFRGRCNRSEYIIHTAAHIASKIGLKPEEVHDLTSINAIRLFGNRLINRNN